ncbi:MAG: energy transducer TonB [Candidatus Binatia bacterium]
MRAQPAEQRADASAEPAARSRALPFAVDALRFPIAALLGLALTGVMFWFLWVLINVHIAPDELRPAAKIEFTRLRRDTEVRTIKREKPELEKPAAAPSTPQVTRVTFSRAGADVVASDLLAPPGIDAHGSIGGLSMGQGLGLGGSDRDVMPLVRINPDYPPRAQSRGIQGWVIVQFTITAAGTVADARVVEAQPKGIFDDAAVKAVSRWKYNPMVQDGVAVERRGIQVRLTFQLES